MPYPTQTEMSLGMAESGSVEMIEETTEQEPKLKHPLDADHAFIRYGVRRIIKNNQNLIIVVVGRSGSGKSFLSLSLAWAYAQVLGTEFGINNIHFTPTSFMGNIVSKPPSGTPMVFEEVGVNVGARDWQQKTNIVLGYVFQTFRSYNYITILNVPHLGFIDKTLRTMAHVVIRTERIHHKAQLCEARVLYVCNDALGTMPTMYRYGRSTESLAKIKLILVPKPPQELIDKYEKKKQAFNDQLMLDVYKQLTAKPVETQAQRRERERQEQQEIERQWRIKHGYPV